jgi:hypothetical protein
VPISSIVERGIARHDPHTLQGETMTYRAGDVDVPAIKGAGFVIDRYMFDSC